MSKKIEVIQAARSDIEQNGIVFEQYRVGECYCAVGYVLKALGITNKEMDALGVTRIDYVMKPGFVPHVPNEVSERVSALALEAGFRYEELIALQRVNDRTHKVEAVFAQLDLMEQILPPA